MENPQKLNETIMGLIKPGGLRNHGSWTRANENAVKDQEHKEKKKWKEWISKETRDLIIRRREAMYVEDECLARELKKFVRKQLREDKRKWEDELTKN